MSDLTDLIDSPTGGLSPLMDMRVKLTKANKENERLTIDVERWKSIASQIESDWIPANRKLSADVAKLRHEADGLLIRNEKLEAALDVVDYALTNIWAIDRGKLKLAIADAIAEVNDENG